MTEFIERPASTMSLAKRKLVFGKGINDADYLISYKGEDGKQITCPYYIKWYNMLKRAYCPKYHAKQPTYVNCSVSPEWLTFSKFKSWMVQQDWQGNELDKDLLVKGNKVYGPTTCIFVPRDVNSLFLDHGAARGAFPIGVDYHKPNNKYRASCRVRGKVTHIGCYQTPEAAHRAYNSFKRTLCIIVANEQSDVRIRDAILNQLDNYHEQ